MNPESFDRITIFLTNIDMRPARMGRGNVVSGYVFKNCDITRLPRKKSGNPLQIKVETINSLRTSANGFLSP